MIGAGPAGAAAALTLAPRCRTVLIDRAAAPADRIGETLPAAAGRLLDAMDLRRDFDRDGHEPCYARRSVWGGPDPVLLNSLRDPDGPGWRLDRRRFEARLRRTAEARGAHLIAPASARVRRSGRGWRVEAGGAGVEAPLLIDAGGRGSRLLRPFGARRGRGDRLICAWTRAPLRAEAPAFTDVASAPDGWWYSAPLPGGQRILAFHTDGDLDAADGLADTLVARAGRLPALAGAIADADFAAADPVRICAAHGARLAEAAGEGWLAAGDAALCFDPLSSQGLFNALYTGHRAAGAALAMLDGDTEAGAAYAAGLEPVWRAYCFHRAAFYGTERRWPDEPFWRRRRDMPAAG